MTNGCGVRSAKRGGVRLTVLAAALAMAGCSAEAGSAPVVTLAETGASNPTVAHDARAGRTYVAWVGRGAGGEANVYLAASTAGREGFAAPVRVNHRAGDAAPHEQAPAQVAVGPEGNVYVVWQNNTPVEGRRFPASDLRFARSTDGGRTFGEAITVNDDAGGAPSSHTFQDLVTGPDGAVYVSWIDSRARDAMQHTAHGHGGGHAEAGLPGPEIRIARSDDGGESFGPSAVVASDACPCCRTALAVGPDGALYLGWRQVFEGDVRDVVVARAEPGGLEFGDPVRVHADGWVFPGCPHAGPSLTVDREGRVHVAWYTGQEGRQGLWYAASADGGRSYGEPVPMLTGEWVPPVQARLALEGGEVRAAWDDRREEERRVHFGRLRGGEWVETGAVAAGFAPDAAPAADGVVVGWLDGDAVRVSRLR